MSAAIQHIVIPYRKARNGVMRGEMRQASNADRAQRLAEAMSARFEGVGAYTISIDTDTGDIVASTELFKRGTVPDLIAEY